MLAGLLYPTSGSARVLGYVPWERDDGYRRQFALLLGQKNQLWWDLPARESLELNAKIYGIPADRFERTVAEMTRTARRQRQAQRHRARTFPRRADENGTDRRRCCISPKCCFSTSRPSAWTWFRKKPCANFCASYNATHKTTILLTSHYMADIQELCQRVIIIDHGTIFFDGQLSEVVDRFADFKIVTIQ